MPRFELVVIGSGPAGQRAAVQSAKLGHSVAIVEKRRQVGGVSINTGTIPSKTLREAVLDLSGVRRHALYGEALKRRGDVSMQELLARADRVMGIERDVVQAQLARNGVQVFAGVGAFEDPHTVSVTGSDPAHPQRLEADAIVIAVGSTPGVPSGIEVDHRTVMTSDDILTLATLPRSLVVVGAGIIGVEYATMFAALGVEVTLLDQRDRLLDMVDAEVVQEFTHQIRAMGITLRLGERVDHLQLGGSTQALAVLASGKRIAADLVLVSAGRQGATSELALERAGLTADARGRIAVGEHYQTTVPHLYAVGDVIGAPALASTSSEQGRLAACHAFGIETASTPELFPYGIYAIPEVAWVGATEADLTARGVPYEVGVARYREIARGQILGDPDGMLKLIVHLETRRILGVWIMGTQATELVHIGQAVMGLGGTLDYLVYNVFNYPTLAECYKVAALDGYNKLRTLGAIP